MLFCSHWSDNHNQLGTPSKVKTVSWNAPYVYFHAHSLAEAKAKVKAVNEQLTPTEGLHPAHIPIDLLTKHGMEVKF